MSRPTLIVELASDPGSATDLAAGGVFVPVPECGLTLNDECELVVRGASGELALPARVVYIDPAKGAGLELLGFGPTIKERIVALATAPVPAPEPAADPALVGAGGDDVSDDGDDDDEKDDADAPDPSMRAATALDKLRGLSLPQQVRKAASSNPATRMALERIYGKAVWEALLRNPRLTAPEVSKLARMGTMPRVLLEHIVNNGAWLQIPEVRRALLTNPRLGTDQILRVLRLMPKHELKVASTSATYTFAVRDAAKRMIIDD
ncbi:MAG: PilZ domain-containing protein [Myxococcales bacterium]|nr:PilZ domain-containing protein [Myxococcales bacterium]